jgi:nickel transport system permease protein
MQAAERTWQLAMKQYIIKRVLAAIPLTLGISFLCFVFINLIPSDPAEVALRVRQTPVITDEAIAEVREELGLNDPFLVRYARWLGDCLRLDFGVSYTNPSRTVLGEISRCLPATLKLAGLSLVFVVIISLPVGFLSAVYKDSLFDRIIRGSVFLTTAMPPYWVGLLLIWLVSIKLDLLPTSGNGGIRHLILPAFTVSLTYISTYIRLIRTNMLENKREDYVLYANVRGLKQSTILVKHILKNSLQSCVTAFGMSIPQLISGTIVVENVFAWPGIGKLCITAIFNRDYPVIQAYVLLIGVLFVVFNLVFDVIQFGADPRLRKDMR